MNIFKSLGIISLALISGACATITRGTSQDWTVTTEPAGATVSLSNGERCKSPCTLKLKRKFPFKVEICRAEFETVVTDVQSSIKGAGAAGMAGNVLVGGLIGIGIDAGTGANKDLIPNPMAIKLVPATPGCTAPSFPEAPEKGQTPEQRAKQTGAKK
jgi:hypothetical protein